MGKLPAFQFYPNDWRTDPELCRCSKSARDTWMDMLCLMFHCEERGILATNRVPWSLDEIAAAVRGPKDTNLADIQELLAKGVASRRSDGAIFSRRMVRDERDRQKNATRQSKFRSNGGGDPERWGAIRVPILERDQYICAYCGRKADTVDHIVPKSKGGTEADSNLVACCKRCNSKKSDRTPQEAGMDFWPGWKQLHNGRITALSEDEDEKEVENEFDGSEEFEKFCVSYVKADRSTYCGEAHRLAVEQVKQKHGIDTRAACLFLRQKAHKYWELEKFPVGMRRWLEGQFWEQPESAWGRNGNGNKINDLFRE